MSPRPFVPGGHIPLPPVTTPRTPTICNDSDNHPDGCTCGNLDRAGTIRAVHLIRELPNGPDASHHGQLVARITLDTLVVGRVEHASPRGGDGFVLLSDGTHRATRMGDWFIAAWVKPS